MIVLKLKLLFVYELLNASKFFKYYANKYNILSSK